MKNPFVVIRSRQKLGVNKSQLRDYARNLIKPGFGSREIKAGSPVNDLLLSKGISHVMVSEHAKLDVAVVQLERVLGVKHFMEPQLSEPSILFNVPKFMIRPGARLFSSGQVNATAGPKSGFTKITLSDVRAGKTDFGEAMLSFMELNGINSIGILTDLTTPRYKRMGFGGAVYGDRLGMKAPVDSWTTFVLGVDGKKCTGCFNCIVVCPSESINLVRSKLTPLEEIKAIKKDGMTGPHPNRVEIDAESCKGCGLCVTVCSPNAINVGEKNG